MQCYIKINTITCCPGDVGQAGWLLEGFGDFLFFLDMGSSKSSKYCSSVLPYPQNFTTQVLELASIEIITAS